MAIRADRLMASSLRSKEVKLRDDDGDEAAGSTLGRRSSVAWPLATVQTSQSPAFLGGVGLFPWRAWLLTPDHAQARTRLYKGPVRRRVNASLFLTIPRVGRCLLVPAVTVQCPARCLA